MRSAAAMATIKAVIWNRRRVFIAGIPLFHFPWKFFNSVDCFKQPLLIYLQMCVLKHTAVIFQSIFQWFDGQKTLNDFSTVVKPSRGERKEQKGENGPANQKRNVQSKSNAKLGVRNRAPFPCSELQSYQIKPNQPWGERRFSIGFPSPSRGGLFSVIGRPLSVIRLFGTWSFSGAWILDAWSF